MPAFESRRFSEIGLLPDPGIQDPTPDPIPGWDNVSYAYGDTDHVHAVTALSNGSTYTYDANGNQICRVENSQTFVQIYNTENRFAGAMLVSGTCASPGTTLASWVFTYDRDGTRVKQVYTDATSTLTTYYFFGGAYEVQDDGSTETILKYYSFAGGMVAMASCTGGKCSAPTYFLTDHLSSVITLLDASGNLLSEQRYLPFGQVRSDMGGITQTDFGYTSQRDLPDLGLMDYRARFYSPYLNHFTQPDSVVPELANPQSLNRYAYVFNNPVRFTDPSGHLGRDNVICTDDGYCGNDATYGDSYTYTYVPTASSANMQDNEGNQVDEQFRNGWCCSCADDALAIFARAVYQDLTANDIAYFALTNTEDYGSPSSGTTADQLVNLVEDYLLWEALKFNITNPDIQRIISMMLRGYRPLLYVWSDSEGQLIENTQQLMTRNPTTGGFNEGSRHVVGVKSVLVTDNQMFMDIFNPADDSFHRYSWDYISNNMRMMYEVKVQQDLQVWTLSWIVFIRPSYWNHPQIGSTTDR